MKPNYENVYKYHAPTADKNEKYKKIRDEGRKLAELIGELCPDSRERSLAWTKTEEAVMWANASIARNEVTVDVQ